MLNIRSMVYLRNNSIFAHGSGPVGEEDHQKFKRFVEDMFQELCGIEGVDLAKEKETMEWINPMGSKYYPGMEV